MSANAIGDDRDEVERLGVFVVGRNEAARGVHAVDVRILIRGEDEKGVEGLVVRVVTETPQPGKKPRCHTRCLLVLRLPSGVAERMTLRAAAVPLFVAGMERFMEIGEREKSEATARRAAKRAAVASTVVAERTSEESPDAA